MTQNQKWPKIKNDQKPIMSQIQKWPKIKSRSDATALRAEGAQADVWSALHSPDHPPFFVFLSFSCFYIYCGSMCSMGSMWAQQSYSAVLHLHLWWYYCLCLQSECKTAEGRRWHKPRRIYSSVGSEGALFAITRSLIAGHRIVAHCIVSYHSGLKWGGW